MSSVTWSGATLPTGYAHEERPQGTSRVGAEILEGSAGRGSGDPCAGLSRQIAAEHELEIVSGKVARDHIRLFVSYGANQDVSQIMQWLKGDQLAGVVAGISSFAQEIWARHFWARGYLAVSSGMITDEMILSTSMSRKVSRSPTTVDFQSTTH